MYLQRRTEEVSEKQRNVYRNDDKDQLEEEERFYPGASPADSFRRKITQFQSEYYED